MTDLTLLQNLFEEHQDNDNAFHMEKYMRNQFSFYGIKAPLRRKLTNHFFKETDLKKKPFNPDLVRSLWKMDEREYQLVAVDYLEAFIDKLKKEDLNLLEEFITTKSWWDTVDMLAQKGVGKIAKEYPEVIPETIELWILNDNLWLKRSAILFQLKYKEDTNEELLYRYIRTLAGHEDFFIRKAIGWVLREYSKTNPESVRDFIENNKLAKLSVREGSKYI